MERINISIIVEQVGKLIEKYSNDEETQKAFCIEVEKRYFPTGEYRKDLYGVEEATAQSWRRQMPKLTYDNVVPLTAYYYELKDETIVIIGIMQLCKLGKRRWESIVPGTTGQALSELYTAITDKVISELYNIPEIIALTPIKIDHGDGDEGCLYFYFKGNCKVDC